MKLTLWTADSAQPDPSGKAHALGLGWSVTTTPTPPMALVVFVDIGTDEEIREEYSLKVLLVDDEKNPVKLGPEEKLVRFRAPLQMDRARAREVKVEAEPEYSARVVAVVNIANAMLLSRVVITGWSGSRVRTRLMLRGSSSNAQTRMKP
ncbi:hypothetical protein AB0C34_25980 [Nocardia sp. NPDC049220]|uniref:hypothetical protein n=1 Tax=Nocardia sp. NPDC049220 TaxID=3155273 RepID=UPI0033E6DEDA